MCIAFVFGVIVALISEYPVVSFMFLFLFIFALYALSYVKKVSTTFILNNTKYGSSPFKVDVNTKNFMLISLKTMGIAILIFMMSFIVVGTLGYLAFGLEYFSELLRLAQDPALKTNPEVAAVLGKVVIPLLVIGYFVLIFASIFIMAYKTTRERSYIFENTTLDEKVKFASSLEALPFGWLLFSNLLLIIITLGFATPWAKVRLARYIMSNTLVESEIGLDAFITHKTNNESSLGEQIGDAFDVDVGIGI